jgi:hypothetical protein
MTKLVAFVGFKSSGKNTAALPLIEHHAFLPISFADALKDALAAIFSWPREMLEGITLDSRKWRETVDPWWSVRLGIPDFSPRWAMMNFGTDIMRKHFHSEIWVLNVERRIELAGNRPVVLTDARFPNEIALARKYSGKVIRIQRGPDPEWMHTAIRANAGNVYCIDAMQILRVHPSEYSWVGTDVDVTIRNDGNTEQLWAAVLDWLQVVIPPAGSDLMSEECRQ